MARTRSLPRELLEAVKFEHTVFALPFAYLGAILAARGWPGLRVAVLVTLAMAGGRTLALAANRLIDRRYDADNPRTAERALPAGRLKSRDMALLGSAGALVMLVSAALLNPICLALAPLAAAILVGYSYVKRVSWLCHLVLGIADAGAPLGGWLAVTGNLSLPALLLGLAVALWVGGFDLIYACQDVEVDRRQGLRSVPARFGLGPALWSSALAHALTVVLLLTVGALQHVGPVYFVAVAAAAALMIYEHSLVSPRDLRRLDAAFFAVNGYIAVLLFAGTFVDQVILRSAWRPA